MKRISSFLITIILTLSLAFTANAASQKIEFVSVTVEYDGFVSGSTMDEDEIIAKAEGPNYSVSQVRVINKPMERWTTGDVPAAVIEVTTDMGYKFSWNVASADGLMVKGDVQVGGAQLSEDMETLSIGIYLDEVIDNGWEENWSDGPFYNTDYTGGGPGTSSGSWMTDKIGKWYRRPDNSYPKNEWELINNRWYYFDDRGYRYSGWVLWGGLYYYCDSNGVMLTNTWTPDGYFVDRNGVWDQTKERWATSPGKR